MKIFAALFCLVVVCATRDEVNLSLDDVEQLAPEMGNPAMVSLIDEDLGPPKKAGAKAAATAATAKAKRATATATKATASAAKATGKANAAKATGIAAAGSAAEEAQNLQRNTPPADEDEQACPECDTAVSEGQARATGGQSEANFCWRDTKTRGVGKVPTQCAKGQERIGLFCYKDCAKKNRGGKAMKRFGFDCHSVCPAKQADQGLFCRSLEYGRGVGYAEWNKDKCEDENPPKAGTNALGQADDANPDSFTVKGLSSEYDAKYTRSGPDVNDKPAYVGNGVGKKEEWFTFSGTTGTNRWTVNAVSNGKGTGKGYVSLAKGQVPWDKKSKGWEVFKFDNPERPQVRSATSRRLLGSAAPQVTPRTITFSGFTGPHADMVNGPFTKGATQANGKDTWAGPRVKGNQWHLCFMKNYYWIGDQATKHAVEYQWHLSPVACTQRMVSKTDRNYYHLEAKAPGAVPWAQQPAGAWLRRWDKKHGAGWVSATPEISQVTAGCEKSLAMWYPKCKPGYTPFGCCICRPAIPKCASMGLRVDLSCAKKVEVTPPKCGQCASPLEMNGGLITQDGKKGQCGLCYPKCPANMDGVGPVCWGKPPKGDPKAKDKKGNPAPIKPWVKCGMGAAASKKACAAAVKSQVSSVFKMVGKLAAIGATAGGSAITTVAAAKMFNKVVSITDKVVSIGMDPEKAGEETVDQIVNVAAPDDVKNAYETAKLLKSAIEGGDGMLKSQTREDIARNAAKLLSLVDPTGVSGVVAAYTFPKCHKIKAGGVKYA